MTATPSTRALNPNAIKRSQTRAIIWLGALAFSATAATAPATAGRHAALIVDGNTGRVISENAADEPRFPASLTKMMTLYVVFELIEQGKLSYTTSIVFSDAATRVQPTKLGVKEGGSVTVLEAIKSLITKSANDASVALAEHIAGTEPKFAALMTQTARRIGMSATTFKNAHGLPNSEQVTTARDMVTLGLRLQDDFPKHYPLFSMREFSFRGDSHRNHNTMLLSYEGTDGIKTGYIGSSGFNLVANVRRQGRHVIGVVFGGPSAAARNQTMRNLLNVAMVRASTVKTRQTTPIARGKPVPAPVVVTRPAPVQPTPVQIATEAAPTKSPITADVEIARVRPLLVAPRPPKPAALAVPVRLASNAPSQNPMARMADPEPLPIAIPQLAATAAPLAAPSPTPAAAPLRGLQPSTFQQQAQNLTRTSEPTGNPPTQLRPQVAAAGAGQAFQQPVFQQPASRLNGPATTAATPPGIGPIQIQVGAYATRADADKQLASVKAAVPQLLANHNGQAIAANASGKPIYRARFIGFDGATAGNICNELRRRQIDCMVTKAE
jgi:D-alanyl-D-alanine carboxypeptidase